MKRILALALAFVLVLGYIPVGVSAADGDYTVAGTFNGWSTTATPMTDNRNGTHTVTLPLAAGYYEFKVTDGTWNNNWGGTGPDGNYPLTVVRDCDVTFKFLLSGEKASVLVDDKVTVYFVNSENWTNVYAYTWSDSQLHMGAWGGTRMTNVADNIWSVKIPAADASNIIFHNGSGTQTGNLSVPYDGRLVYTYNSGWTTCASSHLMSNGTCQICGASCSHSSHGTDGNCSSCGLNVGHSYPSTGLCACGLQAEALVDDIHFASFDSAINVVSPGGTIKLLTDVTTGTVNGNNGHNLDLNGKTLTVSELWAPSTSFLRIQDNTTAQEGKIVGDVYTSQYLYLEGGTIEGTVWLTSYSQLKGSFTMTGGAIKADTDLYINTDGAAVELQGGEFIDGLKLVNRNTVSIPMTLADTISSGYGFYQNGSVVDMTGVTDTISGSTVKVQNHTHAYSSTTGFCPCGDECAHSSKTNGVCDTCGMADAHTHEYVNGACSCGRTAQVLVTYSDSTTKYFDTLQDALDTFSKNNSFAYVKLLTHIAVGDNISADIYTHYTLDLNGYSLTAERVIVPASGGMEIMDSSVGQTGQVNAIVHAHGPLTIWSGTFNDTVLVTTMSNVKGSVTVRDGKFTAATDFQIADDDCSLSLWSGTFPGGIKVEAISGATKDELAGFLYNNNSYFQNCEKVTLTAGQSEISSGHVVVAYDAKHQFGSNTKCSYCGLDAIVSMSLDGVTTYYGTVYDLRQDLVQENAGCTIQLLTDITTTYFADKDGRCGFYLDLNGHTLTASDGVSLPGSSGCTIMDTSAEKNGKIVGTVYAAYSTALTGGTIEGTVSFPKKASATGYTFQMEGGAIHADMDFGINDNNTTIELTGGSFPGGISIACGDYVTTPMTLADCISGSYKYMQNGKVVTLTDGQTEITGGDVTIASHAVHTYEDGKCTGCGAECPHDTYSEGICDVCGRICPHSANTNGVCDECGESLAIQVSIGGQVGYYNDLEKAFEAVENCTAADNAQIKLLKDLENVPAISTWGGVVTLDMNGKSITGEADNYGSVLDFCNTTVTIIGDGSVNGAYGVLHVDVKANVTINSGTFTSNSGTTMVTLHGNCNVSINGGTFEGGIYTSNYTDGDAPKVEIGGTASVQGLSIYDGATVTINGGTFGGSKAITVEDGATLTVNGGTIDGTDYEFYYYNAESADVTVNKASFPNDLKVNTPVLNQILGENAMYYKGSQTVKPLDTDTKITGAVTVDAHSHFASHYYNMVHPTCTEDGTKAYFLCEGCGKKFEDREATKELTDLTIPAGGHFFDENGFCANILSGTGEVCGGYEKPEGEGTESAPYLIDNAGKLFWFAAVVNGGYEDTNGNSAACAKVTEDITIPEGMAWTPISGYRGIFDGGNHSISGMHVSSDAYYVGMFSKTGTCTIKDLSITDSSFETTNIRGYVGAIAGYCGDGTSEKATITGCYVGDVTVTGWTAGGITGCLYNYSEVKNCSTSDSLVVNAEQEGGIVAGRCQSGSYIEWVSAQGTVTGYYAGGIVGYVVNDAGPYVNRSNEVVMSTYVGNVGNESTLYAGGIIGYVSSGSKAAINNCSAKCNVTAEYSLNSRACGLLGHSNNGSNSMVSVSNSFTIDTTLNPANINKASLASGGATVTNCYSDDQETILTLPSVIEVNCAKKTDEQFRSGEVAYLLDAPQSVHVWGQNIDNGNMNYGFPVRGQHKVYQVVADCRGSVGYSNTESTETPSHNYVNGFCANELADGTVCDAYEPAVPVTSENYAELGLDATYEGYYAIGNAGQLYWFADKVDNENDTYKTANVVLTADITVNTGTMDANTTGAREWNPIGYWVSGRDYAAFGGTFDGNNKKISGLYFNNTESTTGRNAALIAETESGALVKNVTVTNTWFHGYGQVAGIVGDNGGTITGCVSEASLSCTWSYIGGMAGWNEGTITGCINRGTIAGSSNNSGGIVGHNAGTVELCGNEGNISDNWCYAGGIAGNNAAIIRNCWNTGEIYVTNNIAGGITGMNNSDDLVENCWSTGVVSCGRDSEAIGGIVGRSQSAIQKNCYSLMEPVGQIKDKDGGSASTVENMDRITLEQLASGEVAYLLRIRAAEGTDVWGQNIDNGETVQTVPALNGADVYYGYFDCASTEAKLTNTAVSATPVAHDYDNGFCTNELTDGTVCDAYEPAVLVTAENREELGLAESYIGYYAIGNAGQLYWFADSVDNDNANFGSAKAVLTKNITVNTSISGANGRREWNPIGYYSATDDYAEFSGTFDGNGKTVSGLYFSDENVSCVGLIAYTVETAVVKNVTLTNSYFCGHVNVGGIVGSSYGTISGCVNGAETSGEGQIGGITGKNEGTVELCGNTGSVTSGWSDFAGGITGINRKTIRNCWNTANIESQDHYVGGIAGSNNGDDGAVPLIENCWSTGNATSVAGRKSVGGVVGNATAREGGVRNCYSLMNPVGLIRNSHPVTNVEAVTLDQVASGEVAYLLRIRAAEGTDVWGQNIDNDQTKQGVPALNGADVYQVVLDCAGSLGYSNTNASKAVHNYVNGFCTNENAEGGLCDAYEPAVPVTDDNYTELGLTADYVGYYAISNAGQLYWFADKVDNEHDTYGSVNVVLTDNITVNSGTITANSTGVRVWNPIGYYNSSSDNAKFSGTFDGNGKTVSGLYFNNNSTSYAGLVSYLTAEGTVKNVTVTNSYIMANDYAGAIAGHNAGLITGCINHASINTDGSYAAGIAGRSEGTVELCGNTGAIYADWAAAGGIVGRANGTTNSGARIRNCWNTGSISANRDEVGGIVGFIAAFTRKSPYCYVSNCWSTGSVTAGDTESVAGVVGYADCTTVSNCYSTVSPVGEQDLYVTVSKTEQKTLDQFASGEVAYLLGGVWGQDLDNGKTPQTVPTFDGADVYYGYDSCAATAAKYTNDSTVSATTISHDWAYTANGAEITAECLNGCGTDGGKVTLTAPANTTYAGVEKSVTVEGSLTGITSLPEVAYEGSRVNVGTFIAKLTVGDATAQLPVQILPYELQIQTFVPEAKVYDGTTTCGIKSLSFVSTANGEELVLGTDFTAQLTFPSADAGEYTDVVMTVTLMDTALAGNYKLKTDTVTAITHTITPATITVANVQVENKIYDATTDAAVASVTASGIVTGDDVKVEARAAFADKNAGESKTANLTYTLTGADAGNYALAETTGTTTATITAATITVTDVQAEDKVYDGTADAAVSAMTVSGIVTGDDVKVETVGAFADKNSGEDKAVTVTYTLTGAGAGNYVLAETTGATTASITPATITVTNVQVENKVYDGTTDAAVASMRVSGMVTGEDVKVETVGAFADKNCGEDKAVTVTYSLTGADAGNYVLAETTGTTTATITPATITVTDVKVADKVYDGTTDVTVTGVVISGNLPSDDVKVTVEAALADKNSGENKTVNLTYTLSGADAGNYALAETTGTTTASITAKALEDIMNPVKDLTVENVTSDDKDALEDVKQELEDVLTDEGLSDDDRKEREDALQDVQDMLDRIEEAGSAPDTDAVGDTLDTNADNVTPEDRENIEQALEDLKDALDEFGDNYTEEQKQAIQDAIDRLEEALEVLDQVQAVIDAIKALPEEVQPDAEEREDILAAKDAYDALSDRQKEMIPEELVQKLNDLLADLKLYVLTEGDGQTWSEGELSFTANGPFELFVELKIDGSTVAASNYTVVSGSTIVTLKESYAQTLTAGKHSIKFVYPDGEAVGSFTVVIPTNGSAETGDEAPILLLVVMMSVSLAGAAMLLERKRKV